MKAFIVLPLVLATIIDLTDEAEWTYEDEKYWPGVCQDGHQQSPINIVTEDAIIDYEGHHIQGPLRMRGYGAVDMTAINNGHTLRWDLVPGAPAPILAGGPLHGNYTCLQMHMHWLSEHAINGYKYPLELHIVHIKTGLEVEEALKRPDGLVVVGVLCEVKDVEGADFALEEIIAMVPKLKSPTEGEPGTASIIDMTRFISPDPQSYYTYAGSLTTPDCNEAVTWIVMDKPITVTATQYKILSKVDVGEVANYRNLQPSNRLVYRTATSRASLVAPGLLYLLTALIHCSSSLSTVAKRGFCKLLNVKRSWFGKEPRDCRSVN